MARPLRIEYPGGDCRVTAQGDVRMSIFADDVDRVHLLALLEAVVKRFNRRCDAYCLMDNHYHLLVETGKGGWQSLPGHAGIPMGWAPVFQPLA